MRLAFLAAALVATSCTQTPQTGRWQVVPDPQRQAAAWKIDTQTGELRYCHVTDTATVTCNVGPDPHPNGP
jgi:hypothetical protein